MNKIHLTAIMAVTMACHVQAASIVQASGSVSSLSYQLVDLTPGDQQAAGFTWQEGSLSLGAGVWRGYASEAVINGTIFDASSGQATLPAGSRGTGYSAKSDNNLGTSVGVTRSDVDGLPKQFFDPYRGMYLPESISAGATDSSVWILAPHTEVTITGRTQLWARTDAQSLVDHPLLELDSAWAFKVQANASFSLRVESTHVYDPLTGYYQGYEGYEANLSRVSFQVDGIDAALASGVVDQGQNGGDVNETFSLTIRNPFDQQMRVALASTLSSSSTLVGIAGLVPEPGTWALMGLGLGLMAWRVRASRS